MLRNRVNIRSSAQRKLTAVGRVALISAASRSIASVEASARSARHNPYAATAPISGAPRVCIDLIAQAAASQVVSRSTSSDQGSFV